MTREQFDDLVRSVETGIARRPSALQRKVALLAGVGYAGLLAGLVMVVLVSAGFMALIPLADIEGKIVCGVTGVLILLFGGYAALKALFIRVPPPKGRPVTRAEAPELFKELDDLQVRCNSASFHRVLIEPVCNAGVVQVPRLGVFGWQRNYLLIGLMMLDGLSRDEVRAVLAHEFAHLSRDHGRFSHWLYRLRRSWEEVFQRLSSVRRGEVSMRPFVVRYVDWFWPRFNAHAFVLSRTHEYQADAHSARVAGNAPAASALIRMAILGRYLDQKIWPDIWQLANQQAEPPADLFVRLRDALRANPAPESGAKWKAEALRVTTTNNDTHPCLTERLRALDALATATASFELSAPKESAAEAFLGPALETIRGDVQRLWRQELDPKWRERHARATSLVHRLTSLEQAVPDLTANVDGLWDKVAVTLDLQGGEAARSMMQQILALRPDHVPANFHLGRILLQEGNPEGEAYLERAMEQDDELVPQACAHLHDHYRRSGQAEKIRALAARLDRHEKELTASYVERREISVKDTLIPHGLSEAELQTVRETLLAEPDLARADLGRKDLRHFPKQRFFVLCVRRRRPWHRLPNADADQALVGRLSQAIRLPGRVLVFAPGGGFRGLARKLRAVPAAEIVRRDSR